MVNNGIIIRKRDAIHRIPQKVHKKNLNDIKFQLPKILREIPRLSKSFIGKPQLLIDRYEDRVTVIREDYKDVLDSLIDISEECYLQRLTISEWRLFHEYHGEEPNDYPVTLHDVYAQEDVTIKTGNPNMNNAWLEFYRALLSRYLGIVEAKSPIGFSFWLDDIYGVQKPGKMFYKHLSGVDFEQALCNMDEETLNWAIWETGKFFSRLINAHLYLEDVDRFGNYFIEDAPATKVFRFLDLEKMDYFQTYSKRKIKEMLAKFIKEALRTGFLTQDKLGEFVIVCLGAYSSPFLVRDLTR